MTGSLRRALVATAIAVALPASAAAEATVQLFVADPAGVGFNDPTPVVPVGGNPGTTLGQQRRVALARAAQIWGQTLTSTRPIRLVALHSAALACNETSAALAGASPFASVGNVPADPGFPGVTPNTWYPIALAEKLTDVPVADILLPTQPFHIIAFINPRIGQKGCLPSSGWYYGLDTSTPVGQINFVTVMLHEMGHGLGFTVGPTNAGTGERASGLPSVWESMLGDLSLDATWRELMTDAERAFSARNRTNLVWIGAQTRAAVPQTLGPGHELQVQGAPSSAGTYQAEPATFGGSLPTSGLQGVLSPATDLGGDSVYDGCDPIISDVAGRFALADRGTCTLEQKAVNAQNAGAIALIVANDTPGLFTPGGTAPSVTIPVFGISQADAARLRAAPPLSGTGSGGQPARLQSSTLFRAGTTAGYPRLYAPTTFQQGSSVSHYDTTMTPNQLMEPAITRTLTHSVLPPVDLTFRLLQDIGW